MNYIFESQRLGFRLWQENDKEAFATMNENPKVMKYFPSELDFQASNELYDRIVAHHKKHGYGLYAVELKENGKFIGFIGFAHPSFEADFTPCIEIGWRLDEIYWKKGYATEGAKACLDYGFNQLSFDEVMSFTSLINRQSWHVMEKIGMKKAGEFDHPNINLQHPLCHHVLYKIER